jgi:ubiquinone/menaquinone biosynthesis C-methylase UbiE
LSVPSVPSRYRDVARAFGTLAEEYDASFDPNEVITRLRLDLYDTITTLAPPPARILDINCGTGTDALALSVRGYSVVGVDVTEKMIREARHKSTRSPNVRFVHASYDAMDHLPESEFDLVMSNFGGLNCTDDLSAVGHQVARRLKPSGYFVAVVMPSFSLWETCAYAVRGQVRMAFRRLRRNGTPAEFSGRLFTVYYFNPRKTERQLAKDFVVRDVYAWNIFTPPPHAWNVARRYPRLTSVLERIDRLLCHLPLFRTIGDHYVMILQKRSR